MKNKLLILTGFLIFTQFTFSLTCMRLNYYDVEKNKVVYKRLQENLSITVENADSSSFETLDEYMGIDKKAVYYKGKKIKNIGVKTFEITKRSAPKYFSPSGKVCIPPDIERFKDKNGEYEVKEIKKNLLEPQK